MKSKENKILEKFFNYPNRHWQFSQLKYEIGITESKLDKWLKRFLKAKIIMRIKIKGKMPYYISNYSDFEYKYKKKKFAIEKLYESGFLKYLEQLNFKSIIIFGSYIRSDWTKNSDIDLFMYGAEENLNVGKFEIKLHRDIQVFIGKTSRDLKKFGPKLLKNVIKGTLIKGDLSLELIKNASI